MSHLRQQQYKTMSPPEAHETLKLNLHAPMQGICMTYEKQEI